jgi:soluble lytic murein transglycosylase-like protein
LRRNSARQNDGGQSNFGQSNWSQNSFNQSTPLDGMAAAQASTNGVPVSLVERVIKRESGGNPRAVSRGNYGLMQIRLGTARAMGFTGSAAELLDPQINMTYAVRYLAGAYRAAGGNENRAVALYASGYYYQAKAQGFSPYAAEASSGFAYRPVAFQTDETFGNTAPVYRVRHHRHHAV